MKTFSSLAAVVALWLGVSFLIWLLYRLLRRRDGSRQNRLASDALGIIDEGEAVFNALRSRAPEAIIVGGLSGWHSDDPRERLQEDVRSLLNAIEAQSPYFERVNAAKKKIQKTFGLPNFPPLAEILQIRRDFWAASEIFLIDDIRTLGAELAEAQSYETFQAEARGLLFKEGNAAARAEGDPVELRLSIAREEAAAFGIRVQEAIAAELEKGRLPTPAEVIAVPMNLARAAAFVVREGRTILSDAAATAQSFARAMGVKGLKGAAEELRKARGDLPGQFASAFERAGGLARSGGEGLKRHYEFLLEAQEVRARYAELLARAPILTEKGKQFLARLELERRAEEFRETSGGAINWARRGLVVGIAYLITGLQYVQGKITPQANKQLAVRPAPAEPAPAPAASASEEPIRVLLLPASSYAGGNHGRGKSRSSSAPKKKSRKAATEPETVSEAPSWETLRSARMRDFAGETALLDEDEPAPRPKAKRAASAKSTGSLLHRLSSIESEEQAGPQSLPPTPPEEPARKRGRFRLFGFKRN